MVNVAVYGGSFNPVHLGHVMVPCHLNLNDASIEKIIVMVCYQQKGKNLEPFEHRYEMCKKAFANIPRVEISDLERELGGESITVRTVRELKKRNPDWSVRFVIGSDLMEKAPHWEGWDELIQEAYPLVVGRAGCGSQNGSSPISPVVSSTVVREGLLKRDWKTIERYIPKNVLEYLKEHEKEIYLT